ncbi:uncharacterized protein B0H18DRAFT_515038 [Fomitopsis serialis]|uniref:uncharacterized protein n=1 Tax=Fomitopsis serialis TaxID=139415 RepID=UPI0020075B72|nr:uncharacterized protein B0H18DRAFT_515038 [Neoantrodia serialis]KAH9922534.1 hypothetical protein B0H18DRAFT_515038 [Neoantrodia serialis]
MSTTGDTLAILANLAHDRGLHAAAALTWLAYDYVLSLEDEVDLIWSSADTVPKLLYFISRYFGLIVQCMNCADIPRLYCRAALIWTAIALYTLVFCVEFSLMLRIYALYGQSRLIFLILSSAFAVETLVRKQINHCVNGLPLNIWPTVRSCHEQRGLQGDVLGDHAVSFKLADRGVFLPTDPFMVSRILATFSRI